MSLRRAAFLAALASAACACDSPYRDRGVLSQDVAERLGRLDGADLAQIGEAGPLPPNAAAPPSPDELAVLEPGQRKQAVDLSDVRAAVLEHNLGIKVARIDPAIANERVLRERAKFEWTFGLIADGGRDVNFEPPLQEELWNANVRPNLNVPLADGGSSTSTGGSCTSTTSWRRSIRTSPRATRACRASRSPSRSSAARGGS